VKDLRLFFVITERAVARQRYWQAAEETEGICIFKRSFNWQRRSIWSASRMNRRTRMRSILFKLHLIGGLVAGLFLLILGVSGAVLAFSDEIDAFLQPAVFKVTPQAHRLPVTQLAANAAAVLHSGDVIAVYVPSVRPDRSYWFSVSPGHHRVPRQVFVNQYTGKVLGNLSAVRFTLVMKALHNGTAFSSIVLMFLVPSGLYLWWPLKRIGIKSSAGFRRLSFDLHNSLGFLSSLFLLGFAATGAYMALERWTVPMTVAMTQSKPVWRTVAPQPKTGVQPISADLACAVAQDALPVASILWVSIPREPQATYLVKMRFPEDHSDNGGSVVLIDQFSGNTLDVVSTRSNSAQRVVVLNRAIHTGAAGGGAGRLLAALASLTLPLQAITGACMWWAKRRSRSSTRVVLSFASLIQGSDESWTLRK
jgi:uncharacterized iron-regulated membrane protein